MGLSPLRERVLTTAYILFTSPRRVDSDMSSFLYYLGAFAIAYLGLTIFLIMLSSRVPAAGFFGLLLASYASLLVAATYGVFISILMRLVGHGRSSQWATGRFFKYLMRFTTGITFSIDDPNDYLNKTRPAMAGASEEITRERQSVYMFPEGTRSYAKEPMLLPFKKGAFHLAVQAGVPIVPVVVANYSDVLFVPGWKFKAGNIPVKVLKPIETKGLQPSDVDDLARDTRELMLREIVAITSKARGRPVAMPAQNSGDGVVKASGAEATIS